MHLIVIIVIIIIITSLPKVIWEQGCIAARLPGGGLPQNRAASRHVCQGSGCHKCSRIRSICIVFLKDTCVC